MQKMLSLTSRQRREGIRLRNFRFHQLLIDILSVVILNMDSISSHIFFYFIKFFFIKISIKSQCIPAGYMYIGKTVF